MTKTLRLLFVVALALVVGNIGAQTVITFDASEDKGSRTTSPFQKDSILSPRMCRSDMRRGVSSSIL